MALALIPFWLLFTSHCLFVCYALRPILRNSYWLYNLTATAICSMGGNVIRSFLLGLRPAMLESNYFPLTIIACWYLMNYSPSDIVYNTYKIKAVWVTGLIIEQITKSHSIYASVEVSMKHLPHGALIGIIVVSTLGGMGGALISSYLYNENKQQANIPHKLSEFSKPTWNIKGAFWMVLAYLFTATPYALVPLEKELVEYTLAVLLVSSSLYQELKGPVTPFPINAIDKLFYTISRIPNGEPVPVIEEKKTEQKVEKKTK
eukprot:TRINITY_DN490_c0_g1_i1.p1 TRINITY_DN490_c0_g1~~TRINITY_DN490_c0_g1_i1.p1  ORF type:complete len:261 (+),score=38.81 TRINITY_DN490_c0_g1_i1:232-1014(+)